MPLNGTAANTMNVFTAFLNCRVSARNIATTDVISTTKRLLKPFDVAAGAGWLLPGKEDRKPIRVLGSSGPAGADRARRIQIATAPRHEGESLITVCYSEELPRKASVLESDLETIRSRVIIYDIGKMQSASSLPALIYAARSRKLLILLEDIVYYWERDRPVTRPFARREFEAFGFPGDYRRLLTH